MTLGYINTYWSKFVVGKEFQTDLTDNIDINEKANEKGDQLTLK